ncbi:hypothetical protein CB0940_02259 [Cercospora beticola]|uniref:Extracellular membrane protein CFEM domain-containing protein n=1 Tax=Cercospora beticola TaxID=122368 RepID=A0A2G5IAV4_CERBT|nr:hypothetical protein CB0940_02259 [Cercospora beticola]PIB01603.1 hypothetical protein CB0940_02259 [Cercospora beticola]WPA97575.1 hypothetical protein RHO25_002185 [Cercospora beticola]
MPWSPTITALRALALPLFLATASAIAMDPDHIPRQADCLTNCRSATTPNQNTNFCSDVAWINTFNACLSCAIPAKISDTFREPIQYLASRCGYEVKFPSPDENQHQNIEGKLRPLPLPSNSNRNTNLPRSDHKSTGPSVPAIAGGVIGAILALAALFILILYLDRRRRKRQQSEQRVTEEHMKCVSEIFGFANTGPAGATPTRGPHSRNVSETYSVGDGKDSMTKQRDSVDSMEKERSRA